MQMVMKGVRTLAKRYFCSWNDVISNGNSETQFYDQISVQGSK